MSILSESVSRFQRERFNFLNKTRKQASIDDELVSLIRNHDICNLRRDKEEALNPIQIKVDNEGIFCIAQPLNGFVL
jgi:hypothetical protein